jgi:hypothetical protein
MVATPEPDPPLFPDELVAGAGERAVLETFLDLYRDAIVRKLGGVSEEDARRRLVGSATTLGGIVKHLRWVELEWFQRVLAGRSTEDLPPVPGAGTDPDAEFHHRDLSRRGPRKPAPRPLLGAGQGGDGDREAGEAEAADAGAAANRAVALAAVADGPGDDHGGDQGAGGAGGGEDARAGDDAAAADGDQDALQGAVGGVDLEAGHGAEGLAEAGVGGGLGGAAGAGGDVLGPDADLGQGELVGPGREQGADGVAGGHERRPVARRRPAMATT